LHSFNLVTCDKMVLCAQPFRTRKPYEYEKGEYGKFYGSTADNMIGPMTQIHYIAENEVTFKSLIFDPDNQPPEQFNKHRQATEMIKLHIRRVFVTNDFADMMPSDYNFVQNVLESDDPPLNVTEDIIVEDRAPATIRMRGQIFRDQFKNAMKN
jgi:heat shock protein beta